MMPKRIQIRMGCDALMGSFAKRETVLDYIFKHSFFKKSKFLCKDT